MKTDEELILHWNTVCEFIGLTGEEVKKLKSLLFEKYEVSLHERWLYYKKREEEGNVVVVQRDSSQGSLSVFGF